MTETTPDEPDRDTVEPETAAVEPESDVVEEPEGEPAEPEAVESVEPEVAEPRYVRFDCTDPADTETVAAAAEAAREAVSRGECVVLPTDTVYGIGADAFDPLAVQRLQDAKGRGRDKPPPVLISDSRLMRALATEVPDEAKALAEAHWPGPLTIICKAQPSLHFDLGETDGTVGLRVPDHPLARDLLRRTGPLAVSSANLSGKPAAVTCEEAEGMLGDSVAVYLDGGRVGRADGAEAAPSSTLVDFSHGLPGRVLRLGALSLETLQQTCPELRGLSDGEPEPVLNGSSHSSVARLRHTLQPPPDLVGAAVPAGGFQAGGEPE